MVLTPSELRAYHMGQAYAYHRVLIDVLPQVTEFPTNFADVLRDSATDSVYSNIEADAVNQFPVASERDYFMQGVKQTFVTLRSIPYI